MKVRVERSENGLALVLPQSLIDDLNLREGVDVEVVAESGRLSVRSNVPTLDELLSGITPENVHPETDWGPAVGRETW